MVRTASHAALGDRLLSWPRAVARVGALAGLLQLAGCGSDSGSVMSVLIDNIRTDTSQLDFKFYRAACLGAHPCDTWLAQATVEQYSHAQLAYQLSLPAAILDLAVYLRVETTESATACIGARATASAQQRGADYAGTTIELVMSVETAGPPFKISMPNACPFFYAVQGTGLGDVVLARSGYPDLTDASQYPDEFPRATQVTATAQPKSGSHFTMWSSPPSCAGSATSSCTFSVEDSVRLSPVFDKL